MTRYPHDPQFPLKGERGREYRERPDRQDRHKISYRFISLDTVADYERVSLKSPKVDFSNKNNERLL